MKNAFRHLFIVGFLASVYCAAFQSEVEDEFEAFKVRYGKEYENPVEESFRMKIFMENKLKIVSHNKLFQSDLESFKLRMNEFGDMLPFEFATTRKGLKKIFHKKKAASFLEPDDDVVLPASLDWFKMGAVTPVKDQGGCGSCWAFSTTGVLEGQHFCKTGQLVSLSEQNLIDCTMSTGNKGCAGGDVELALLYVKGNRGIDTEQSYPYIALDNGKCQYNPANSGADDVGFAQVKNGSELALQKAVALIGPISVAIDTSGTFQFYDDGVYDSRVCQNKDQNLDHAVLVVGYGTDDKGKDYWLVKNSWGVNWGNQGYIKMARNKNNMCGIATDALYPLV